MSTKCIFQNKRNISLLLITFMEIRHKTQNLKLTFTTENSSFAFLNVMQGDFATVSERAEYILWNTMVGKKNFDYS